MMLAGSRPSFARLCVTSTALVVLLTSAVHAQAPGGSTAGSTASSQTSQADSPAGPLLPGTAAPSFDATRSLPPSRPGGASAPDFQANAAVNFSESYVSNASGTSGASRADYLSTLGFNTQLHEHSRRVDLDANYSFNTDFYAQGTESTQLRNDLQALGNVEAVPGYLNIGARAFAQPVVVSNLGVVTAGNRVVSDGFRNSYGYYVSPDLTFHLGNFAVSDTIPNFGQAFFTTPAGASNAPLIPGIAGPQDTTIRSLTEKITSGPDFERFNWNLVGLFSETDRRQSLLSEKAGIADASYAVSNEFSLLATGGYDAIDNSIRLNKNVSGPVAMGGFGLTYGQYFSLRIEAGLKYNSASYSGNLLYNITPTSTLAASADDYVQTPEGQLLNNLTSLTALGNGGLTSSQDLLGNGTASSLSSFNIQSPGNLSLDQNIARYQVASINYIQEFERNHASLGLFGTRRTILSGVTFGQQTQDSWGARATLSRDFNPLLRGTLGGTYSVNQELGGQARIFQIDAQLGYSLSEQTRIYLQGDYIDRTSSTSLQVLSPFTGSVTDVRATIGIAHSL